MVALGNESVLDGRWNFSRTLASNNSSPNNTTMDDYENNVISSNYQQLAYAVIAALGIVGNGVAIFVISHSLSMRQKFTNILILNQSIIDFVTSVLILISKSGKISNKNLSGLGGDILCNFWITEFPLWSFMVSSSYNMMALTLERYMGIVHPMFHHSFVSRTKIILLAGAAWWPGPILKLCFLVPTVGVINGRCIVMPKYASTSWKKICGVMLFFFEYLLPIAVFVTCYSMMFTCLRNKVHPHAVNVGNEVSVPNARARRNVLKTLVLVVVAYLLCNSFNEISFLAFNFGAQLDFTSYYYNFTVIAMFANCCINPFLYALQYRPYQIELRKAFCKRDTSVVGGT